MSLLPNKIAPPELPLPASSLGRQLSNTEFAAGARVRRWSVSSDVSSRLVKPHLPASASPNRWHAARRHTVGRTDSSDAGFAASARLRR